MQKIYAQGKAPNSHKMMKNPAIANIIQSPFERSSCLWRIACGGTENIWASRNNSQLYEINNKSGAKGSKGQTRPHLRNESYFSVMCCYGFLKKKVANCSEKSILWSQKLTKKERHKIINAIKKKF